MGHEPDRHDWLGTTLRRFDAAPSDTCVDAEMLAAWADGGLSAQAASAVEFHISSCSRCMAVLAALERSAPAPQPRDAWTSARLFRWLVPLTAAATAIAVWVLVPDQHVTSTLTAPVETSETQRVRPAEPETAAPTESPAPPAQTVEPQAKRDLAAPQLRDEFRRERATQEAVQEKPKIAEAPSALASAPPPSAATPSAADSVAGLGAEARRFAANSAASNESISPSNALNMWRVIGSNTIERSTDGGQTWMKTVVPPAGSTANPATIVSVRAVDDLRAVARTSSGTEFYTVDAGLTWTRVQEDSTAPF